MKRTDIRSNAFRRDLAAARRERWLAGQDVVSIYRIRKNGERYARPQANIRGHTRMTRKEAEAEIARLVEYNPGARYEIV